MNGTGRDEHKRDGKCTGPGAIIRNGTGETNGTGATLKNSRPMLPHIIRLTGRKLSGRYTSLLPYTLGPIGIIFSCDISMFSLGKGL